MTLHLSRRSLLVAAALGASTLPFVADIGVAQAASTNGYAFLWADQPTSASYTPSTTYQTNSLGGTNTIVRNGTGDYSITLPGMAGQGGDGGNVQVTAYGSSGTERCKVASWAPNWLGMTVNVRCHSTSGSAADSRFTMMYQNNNAVVSYYDQGYVWANQATTGSYTAPAPYSWSSRGGANTIQRLGTGRYSVTFPSLVVNGGNLQVTAYGTGTEYCNATSWGGTTAYISCFSRTGAPADTQFSASYTTVRMPSSSVWTHGFYAWLSDTANTAWNTPPSPWAWTSRTTMQAHKVSTGVYEVKAAGQATTGSSAVVTAYGNNNTCRIAGWSASGDGVLVTVRCFTPSGALTDNRFSVLYNSNFTV
jgi:hypothetical protein